MTPAELIQQCEQAIASPVSGGPEAKVTLIVPGRFTASGKKRLWKGAGSPVGKCLSENQNGVICLFSAQEVIDAVKKRMEGT